MLKVRKSSVGALLTAAAAGIATYIIDAYQVEGDVEHYRHAYEAVKGEGFFGGLAKYALYTGAWDIIPYALVWISSQIIEREVFVAIINGVFAALIYRLFQDWRKSIFAYGLLVVPNFYFLVLCFGAERLKIASMFLVAALVARSTKTRLLSGLGSLLSHMQLIILYVAAYAARGVRVMLHVKRKSLPVISLIAVLATGIFLENSGYYVAKMSYYLSLNHLELSDFFGVVIFGPFIVCFAGAKAWAEVLVFALAVAAFGSDRINILLFMALIWHGYLTRRKLNLSLVPFLLYFNAKGLIYLNDILHGRAGV